MAETEQAVERWAFLSTEAAGPGEKKLVWSVVAVSALVFAAAVPFAPIPLTKVPAFIPVYESALMITDFVTALLLYGQFAVLRWPAMLVLAGGYLFNALMAVAHALSFPGLFAETGLFGAGAQSTAWLYMFWHAGFPLAVIIFAARKSDNPLRTRGKAIVVIAYSVFAVLGLVGALTVLATAGEGLLPQIMEGNHYTPNLAVVVGGVWLLCPIAIGVLWRRRPPTVLDLWLVAVMFAWFFDVGLSAVFNAGRFDLGFYAGRIYGLLATSVLLCVLLLEMNWLHGKLAGALALADARNAELVRSREEFARLQRIEAVGQLVGGVAHDFNNLLTVIIGNLDLALRGPDLSPRNRRLLNAAFKASRHGEEITQQLLTFARKQVLRPEVVNPNEIITNLETFFARATGERVTVVMRLDPAQWPTRVDRTQFETALLNLVVNARDAIDGEGRVVIETRNVVLHSRSFPDLPAGDYVLVSVSDAGRGMTPEVAARAFEPFFTTKEVGKGSGLGLSQVYGFVHGAAGEVEIDTKPAEGTSVRLYLPKSSEDPVPAAPLVLPPIRPTRGREAVLVVEDDPDVRDVVVSGLLDLEYRVKTAADAQEALAILRADPGIDLLLSDVVMPGGMNGVQLAAEAQRIRADIKVLLTSGYSAAALSREHGLPATLEVLRKPYRRDEIANKLRLVIGG
jgi:signal transduction histidine kinase/CheY-like chemotaxis protein